MNVYCVESSEHGVMGVFADKELAHYFLRGVVETHSAFCGKVIWLSTDLKSRIDHKDATHATICSLEWKAQATIMIKTMPVLKTVG